VIARRRERVEPLADELRRYTPDSGFVAVLHSVEDGHGRIVVPINNAGISEPEGDGLRPYRE
jgi:short-subunit dehydrogenase